jgi:predicted transcriptional regulator
MKTQNHLLKNREKDFLKLIAREILLNENSDIDTTILHICKRIKIPEEKVRSFVSFLYRHGFLVKYERGQKYVLTLGGVNFLLKLAESCYFSQNLEEENYEHRRA